MTGAVEGRGLWCVSELQIACCCWSALHLCLLHDAPEYDGEKPQWLNNSTAENRQLQPLLLEYRFHVSTGLTFAHDNDWNPSPSFLLFVTSLLSKRAPSYGLGDWKFLLRNKTA